MSPHFPTAAIEGRPRRLGGLMTSKALFTIAVIAAIGIVAMLSNAESLPDNPQTQVSRSIFKPHWLSNREVLTSKPFRIANSVLWTSVVFDSEMTHQGLAYHRCVETNPELPIYPTRGRVYAADAWQAAVVTGTSFLISKAGWKFPGMVPALVGAGQFTYAGEGWLANCWRTDGVKHAIAVGSHRRHP
jgi:hypothetical protein